MIPAPHIYAVKEETPPGNAYTAYRSAHQSQNDLISINEHCDIHKSSLDSFQTQTHINADTPDLLDRKSSTDLQSLTKQALPIANINIVTQQQLHKNQLRLAGQSDILAGETNLDLHQTSQGSLKSRLREASRKTTNVEIKVKSVDETSEVKTAGRASPEETIEMAAIAMQTSPPQEQYH